MITLIALILIRIYWPVDAAKFAAVGSVHTHVQVIGWVKYATVEDDGDLHVAIVATKGVSAPFLIAECLASSPCVKPRANSRVTIKGISRKDPEHGWWEIHPVEQLDLLPP